MPDKSAEWEQELEQELEQEMELKMELEPAELARKFFNNRLCIFKLRYKSINLF